MPQIVTFCVNGENFTFDFSELDIIDTDDLRSKSASNIAYWSTVVANAEEEMDIMEAEKSNWNGRAVSIILKSPDSGSAEWKIKAAIAAQADCLSWDKKLAKQRNTVAKAKAVLLGFQKQHDMLKAMTNSAGIDGARAADLGRTDDNRMEKFRHARQQRRNQSTETGE